MVTKNVSAMSFKVDANVQGLKDSNPKWEGFRIRPQI